jgi:mRNA-degrading endonuclease HigB of HigAB toxin-antitoxin module
MRIIKTSMLREFWRVHCEASSSLRLWVLQTKAAQWRDFGGLRKTFPSPNNSEDFTAEIAEAAEIRSYGNNCFSHHSTYCRKKF